MDKLFSNLKSDLPASLVVFLVAIPLCLGIALASGAPLFSGIISGIIGGVVVGYLSKSNTSVVGPAAGLAAIVLSAINELGAFEIFLLAVVFSGIMQVILGVLKAGGISNFFPSSVINGLLASIGIVIIMKQIPHAVGYDSALEGDFSFIQNDGQNTFSELLHMFTHFNFGALIISIVSILILVLWDKTPLKKINFLPASLIAVIMSIILNEFVLINYQELFLSGNRLVTIPIANNLSEFFNLFTLPDFSQISNPNVYKVAITLFIVASLETLLNLEATDKLDTLKRHSPPNKELIAQGIGNTISGLIGGLPITSVIVRSSVNINNGAKSKLSAIFHGVLLLLSALFIPNLLNKIPLACLAGILIVTGFKLTKLSLYKKMIKKGFNNYLPFFITIVAILFTDLLIGVIVGLVIGLLFILKSNLNNPFAFLREDYHEGEIIRLELSQQLSFLNKASIVETLEDIPENSKLIFDATNTDYIDADILDVINDFRDVTSKIKNIDVNLVGFKDEYKLDNHIQFVNVLTKEIQERLEPEEVLDILMKGNQRFIDQKPNKKEYHHQIDKTSDAQHPMAVILSCIDSRTAAELIFDLGFGDIFSIRLAGNVINEDALGGLEFSCKVSGAKVILVLGHTNCGAIKAACSNFKDGHITHIMEKIDPAIEIVNTYLTKPDEITKGYLYEVTKVNVLNTVKQIQERSETIKDLVKNNKIIIQGGIYDIKTGKVEILKI